MFWLAAIAAVATLASAVAQSQAQRSAGKAQRAAADYRATLAGGRALAMEERAGQERASAQREAAEERRRGRFVASRARALAAASGGGVSDPTVTNILADIDSESELRALTAMYRGEEIGRGLEYGAVLERAGGEGERFAGRAAERVAKQRARATMVSGFAQSTSIMASNGSALYNKYGEAAHRSTYG